MTIFCIMTEFSWFQEVLGGVPKMEVVILVGAWVLFGEE